MTWNRKHQSRLDFLKYISKKPLLRPGWHQVVVQWSTAIHVYRLQWRSTWHNPMCVVWLWNKLPHVVSSCTKLHQVVKLCHVSSSCIELHWVVSSCVKFQSYFIRNPWQTLKTQDNPWKPMKKFEKPSIPKKTLTKP